MKKSKMYTRNNLIIILIISLSAFMQLLIVNGQDNNDTMTMDSNTESDMDINIDMNMDMITIDDMNMDMENSTIVEEEEVAATVAEAEDEQPQQDQPQQDQEQQDEETMYNSNNNNNVTLNLYWPPIYNDETIELDKMLMEKFDLGCSKTTIHTNGMISNHTTSIEYNEATKTSGMQTSSPTDYFMISETENREKLNNPHPTKFVHLPSGKSVELNFECDDCPNNKITFNGKMYDTAMFECKTLCIFTAIKSYKDTCRKGQMYKIGLKLKNKFYNLMESCHHLEMPTNITYDAQTLIWKLGKYSRTMQNEKTLCQPKCMPVCRDINSMKTNNNNNNNNMMDLMESNENYAMKFMETICNKNMNSQKNLRNIENIICVDKTNDGGSILKLSNFGFLLVIIGIVLEFDLM